MKLNNNNDNTLTKWKKNNDDNNIAPKEAKGNDKMTRSIC